MLKKVVAEKKLKKAVQKDCFLRKLLFVGSTVVLNVLQGYNRI